MNYRSWIKVLVVFLLLGVAMLILLSGCLMMTDHADDGDPNTLRWIPEESRFLDYEITENRIRFKYSICFENGFDTDEMISLSAKFARKELKGWLKYESFFEGCDETGNRAYYLIKSGEKVNLVFVFEGEYLGGSVNENLSFPEELLTSIWTPEPD